MLTPPALYKSAAFRRHLAMGLAFAGFVLFYKSGFELPLETCQTGKAGAK
jgi:hypothetical protein